MPAQAGIHANIGRRKMNRRQNVDAIIRRGWRVSRPAPE
jgi:hypothetical protein